MGSLDSNMYESTSFLFCLLVLLVGQCQAKPGVLELVGKAAVAKVAVDVVKAGFTKDCGDYEYSWGANECAIVFDEEDCGENTLGWSPLKIKEGETSFSLTTVTFARYRNDIESLIVRGGCTLNAYLKSDCEGTSHKFQSGLVIPKVKSGDKTYEDLEDHAEDFNEKIKCVTCSC